MADLTKHVTVVLDVVGNSKFNLGKLVGDAVGGGGSAGDEIGKALKKKLSDNGETKVATAEQLQGLRMLAKNLPAGSRGGLAELLPEATRVKGVRELFKDFFSNAASGQGIGGALKGLVGGLGDKFGGSTAMGLLGGDMLGGTGALGGAIGGPMGIAIAGALSGVKKVIDEIVSLPDKFMAVAGKIAGFVQVANPGAVERFNLATRDLVAVFGHGLTPAMEMMRDIVREIADGFAASSLGDEMKSLFSNLRMTFKELGPELRSAAKAIGDMTGALVAMTSALTKAWNSLPAPIRAAIIKAVVPEPIHGVGRALTAFPSGKGGSVGLSAQAATVHSAEGFGIAASIAGLSSGLDPAQNTADNTKRTAEAAEQTNVLMTLLVGALARPLL